MRIILPLHFCLASVAGAALLVVAAAFMLIGNFESGPTLFLAGIGSLGVGAILGFVDRLLNPVALDEWWP